jgi:hypothetical protein
MRAICTTHVILLDLFVLIFGKIMKFFIIQFSSASRYFVLSMNCLFIYLLIWVLFDSVLTVYANYFVRTLN